MKNVWRVSLCLGMLLVSGNMALAMEWVPYKRTVTKAVPVLRGADIQIVNKYGKVTLHRWDQDQLKAVVTITTNGRTADEARAMAENVDIRQVTEGHHYAIQTVYDAQSASSFWKRFFSGSRSGNEKDFVRIDYEVYLPASMASLTVENVYGDVIGDGVPGAFTLKLAYGNFHLSNFPGNVVLNTAFCDGSVSGVSQGRINASYSDLKLNAVHDMVVNASYTNCKITGAGKLTYNGSYGNVDAESLDALNSNSQYTDYMIGDLSGGSMNVTYGDTRIKNLGDRFNGLSFKGAYADLSVGISADLHVRLDIDLTGGDLRTGELSLKQVEQHKEGGRTIFKALSSGADARAPVLSIRGQYSDVSLHQR